MSQEIRILLVDDEIETRNLYAEILRSAGFHIVETSNGLEALEEVNKEKPDLIFSGIIMPKMDGFSLVEALKKNIVTASIPVVFLSHLGRLEDEVRARELGVKDFIIRDTTSPNEVVSRLKAQLSATEYLIALDPKLYDAQKFARDLGINSNFICSSKGSEHYVLKLKLKDSRTKRFDAELTCI